MKKTGSKRWCPRELFSSGEESKSAEALAFAVKIQWETFAGIWQQKIIEEKRLPLPCLATADLVKWSLILEFASWFIRVFI